MLSASQAEGQAKEQKWVLGCLGGGKAGRFGVNLNVNWLPICYQKANEKCLLAQLAPKWSVDLWKIHNSGTSIRKNII